MQARYQTTLQPEKGRFVKPKGGRDVNPTNKSARFLDRKGLIA